MNDSLTQRAFPKSQKLFYLGFLHRPSFLSSCAFHLESIEEQKKWNICYVKRGTEYQRKITCKWSIRLGDGTYERMIHKLSTQTGYVPKSHRISEQQCKGLILHNFDMFCVNSYVTIGKSKEDRYFHRMTAPFLVV